MPETNEALATGTESTPAAGSPAPAAVAPAPSAQPDRQEQARRTEEGRLRKELNDTKTQLTDVLGQVGELKKWRDDREQAEYQAYLESLPNDERMRVELKDTQDQLKAMQTKSEVAPPPKVADPPPSQQQMTDAEKETAIQTRKAQIVANINAELGLTGDFAVDPKDDALDVTNPEAYTGSVRTLGRMLQQAQQKAGAGDGNPQEEPMANKPKEGDEALMSRREQEDAINKRVAEILGTGGSLSAEASGGASARGGSGPTTEDMQNVGRRYDSRQGTAGQKAELQKLKAQAEKALAASGRG